MCETCHMPSDAAFQALTQVTLPKSVSCMPKTSGVCRLNKINNLNGLGLGAADVFAALVGQNAALLRKFDPKTIEKCARGRGRGRRELQAEPRARLHSGRRSDEFAANEAKALRSHAYLISLMPGSSLLRRPCLRFQVFFRSF